MSYRSWTAVFILSFPPAVAASSEDSRDSDPLFASHETLAVVIEAPFDVLTTKRPDEEEAAGKFRFEAGDGTPLELDVAVRTRGKSRRDRKICEFPPMRLNFKKSQTRGTLLDKQDKLKLVTHCKDDSPRYEQGVVTEYLAYRVLNLITDASFRVRLLRITYIYTDDDKRIETYAILIESKEHLGERLDAEQAPVTSAAISDIRPADLNVTSIFQYLLGNTDFSPIAVANDEDCCHNQALLTPAEGLYYSVPYDFDQTGWVNARHARPNPRFRLNSVRQRLYRGRCVNNGYLDNTLQLFRDHRDEIYALIDNQAELSPDTQRYLMKYCDGFFKIIDDPRRYERHLIKSCI